MSETPQSVLRGKFYIRLKFFVRFWQKIATIYTEGDIKLLPQKVKFLIRKLWVFMLIYLITLLESEDDKALLSEIYKEYGKWLNYVAREGLFNESYTDDCVQETFVELINSFGNFKNVAVEKRRPYLKRICERVIYRMNNEHFDTVSYDETTEDNYYDQSEFDFSAYDRSDMAQIIKDLDPQFREPLMLKYGSGYSADEISKMLGISNNLVYQRIHRGKTILYSMLAEE